LNLAQQGRLLTREQWEQRQAKAPGRRKSAAIIGGVALVVVVGAVAALLLTPGSTSTPTPAAQSPAARNLRSYRVPSEAMEPTFTVGSYIGVDLNAFTSASPSVGETVVFHPPQGALDGNRCGVPVDPNRQLCPQRT
jgi:signal peptidase I